MPWDESVWDVGFWDTPGGQPPTLQVSKPMFDPAKPADHSPNSAAEMRAQLNGLNQAIADGKHVVGDDSAINAEGDVVTVYYQDVTVGTLRRAAGAKSGATHKWDLRTLQQPNKFGGYFPQIVPGEDKVANFWEQTDHAAKSRVGDVTILSP